MLTAAIGAKVAGKKKFFSQNINSLSFEELVKRTELVIPKVSDEKTPGSTETNGKGTSKSPEAKGGETIDVRETNDKGSSEGQFISDEGNYAPLEINAEGTFEVRAVTPAGILDPAFKVEKWLGTGHPTIIYHHGNNERPFDYGKAAKTPF